MFLVFMSVALQWNATLKWRIDVTTQKSCTRKYIVIWTERGSDFSWIVDAACAKIKFLGQLEDGASHKRQVAGNTCL